MALVAQRMAELEVTDTLAPEPSFRVEAAHGAGIARVAIFGEIDLGTVGFIEQAIRAEWGQPGLQQLVLDLRGVEFMDSTGLRLLVELHRDAHDRACRFSIVRPEQSVHRVIVMTGLDRLLSIIDDPDELAPD